MFAEEKKELYGAETLYRELGYFQIGHQQYRKSYPAFNKAVELTPTDLRTLIGRSWARAKATHYKCAIDDMNKALAANPNDLRAMRLKAVYTYLSTEFEDSFVQNQRGMMIRKKPDSFIIGAMQCCEEVERCVGKRGGPALRDHYDMIRTIAWKRAIDFRMGKQWKPRFKKRKRKPKKTDNTPALYTNFIKKMKHRSLEVQNSELSILESLTGAREKIYEIEKQEKSEYQPPQKRSSNIDNLIAEKYLEKMCYDKQCLKALKNDPRIFGPNYQGTLNIKTLARKGYRNVAYRQELLRTRQPFYSIKYNEAQSKGALLRRQLNELKTLQDIAKKDAENLIKLLRAARECYLTNTCIQIANKAKTFLDKKTLKYLPNKESFLKQLYDLIGLVYLDRYRLKDDAEDWDPNKRISFLFGLPISREPSQDSVMKQNKKEFMNVRQLILVAENRLAKATTPLETVWLYYDLANYNLALKKYDLSRFYARKALNMAKILENHVWTTAINMLITTTQVSQRNKNESKNELTKTLEFAQRLENPDIIAYINRCYEVIESIDFDEIRTEQVIAEREKRVVSAITNKNIQNHIALLFMRLDAIPPSRRMSIMPGLRFEEESRPVSRKSSSKPSIKPQSKAEIEFQASLSPRKGLDLLDID